MIRRSGVGIPAEAAGEKNFHCQLCVLTLISVSVPPPCYRSSSSSSSSNWILMFCQPHRVTSGQSNSGHKQIHISKLFSHIYQPSVKSLYKTDHFANIKHTWIYTNIRQKKSELVPSVLPLLKEHIRVGHAGIVDHSV